MLIVGADDWGWNRRTTDAIEACLDAGTVTSTSAMVWMRDTVRASEVARDKGFAVGLHLNLTAPYLATDVPAGVRARQARIAERLAPDSWRDPPALRDLAGLVAETIRDQLLEFRARFGPPTHIDGHHYVQALPAVQDALPAAVPLRALPRRPADAGAPPGPAEAALRARFRGPDVTLSFEQVHPDLGGIGLDVLEFARTRVVEIVTHPVQERDAPALAGGAWRAALDGQSLGSYRDLG